MADESLRPLIEKLQETLDEQGERMERVENSVDVLAKHLEPLPGQVDRLGKDLKAFRVATEANFADVQGSLADKDSRLGRLERSVDGR